MKNYQVYFYFLFVLLITGIFASMAQNAYGMPLLGLVALSFSGLFAIQLHNDFKYTKPGWSLVTEVISLVILAITFALRIFNFSNKTIDSVVVFAGAILLLVYLIRMFVVLFTPSVNKAMIVLFLIFYFSMVILLFAVINTQVISSLVGPSLITAFGLLVVFLLGTFFFKFLQVKSRSIALVVLYYITLITYLFSIISTQTLPTLSEPALILAFCLTLVFITGTFFSKEFHLEGEKTSVVKFIFRFKDHSVLVISLFLLFSLYTGFTRIGWLPKMYSSELPQTYYKLLNEAESGKELPVDGQFKHEEFKSKYDEFIKKHGKSGE